MAINTEFTKKFADAYYGPGAVIGDGTLLKKLMEIIMGLIGGCPLGGARRAHAMVNGGLLQQRRAKNRIWWEVYGDTGDELLANDFAEASMKVGKASTVEEFVDFAKP